MKQHTKELQELVMSKGVVIWETFLFSSNVKNICRKGAKDHWKGDPSDPISVFMWEMENPKNVIYY